jgi:hypothetical protein
MKKISLLLWVAFIGLMLSGCNKDPGKNNDTTLVSNTLTSGTWRITYFWVSGTDKTGNFSGYNFTFQSGGIINAIKDSNDEIGIWSPLESGDESDNCDLVISFDTQNFFAELSKKWHVIEVTNLKIRLMDDSGSGGADYLTLEKN